MNIVFYHSSLGRGGAERVIVSLANYLEAIGNNVCVIIIDKHQSEYEINKRIRVINLYHMFQSANLLEAVLNNLRIAKLLNLKLQEINPQVVICFGHSQLLHAMIARKKLNYKIIGSERSNPYLASSNKKWKCLKKILYKKADGFIFQTKGAKKFYTNDENGKGCIIGNPISEDFVHKELKSIKTRNARNFYAIGRLIKTKSFEDLIEAFSIFCKKFPEARLFIYGEGTERGHLEKLISALHMETNIYLPGKVEDVFSVLNEGRYFILPSRLEGMPNVLMEAMACGCACISTNCRFGPEELIQQRVNGILVPVGDKEAMVKAMICLYVDLELTEKLGKQASAIKDKYNIKIIAELYLEYLEYIINS